MLTEMSLKEALKYFMKGRKVLVLNEYDDKSISADRIEDCLPKEAKYLVDVPAVPNQEFEQAVQDMVEPDQNENDTEGDELYSKSNQRRENMRIISQNGLLDAPYELIAISPYSKNMATIIGTFPGNYLGKGDRVYILAEYSTEEKAIRAMEMCREYYDSIFFEPQSEIFQFPAEEEVE